MKQLHIFLFCALCCMACGGEVVIPKEETTKVAAFPGADGGGKYATGGRGGMVYHVTTLEDDIKNPGSLRAVLRMSGKKMIVFDVAGVIELKSELAITEGAVTISGQSAPGNGICIANYPVVVKASNVIIRFVRFRMGDKRGAEGDAFTCRGMKNVIIDHCSFSWSTDECVSCYGNSDFTLQYCFITESLRRSVHVKGNHGYGGIWGGKNATFHHNLLAHHDSRNPRFDHDYVDATCHGPIDYVNNVIYNWGGNSAYGGESVSEPRQINMIANYYKAGPATRHKTRIINPTDSCSNCTTSGKVVPGLFYLEGNYVEGNAQVTTDNYKGMDPYIEQCKAPAAFQAPEYTRETAQEAYQTVLDKAGASLVRDAVDMRVVEEVRNGNYTYKGSNGSTNGLIDSQEDVGGYPSYTGVAHTDTDKDGIPDEWETANGLNPKSYNDSREYTLDKNYTNLEVYLNSLVEDLY